MRAQFIIVGRVTSDLQVKYSQNGETSYTRVGIAVNKRVNGEDVPNFYDCTAFNQLAENMATYLHKGDTVVVSGDINNVSYINKEGATVNTNNFIIYSCDFAGSSKQSPAPAPANTAKGRNPAKRPVAAAANAKRSARSNAMRNQMVETELPDPEAYPF